MFGVACACCAAAYFADGNLYQSIFTTFSCSAILIFALEKAIRNIEKVRKNQWCCLAAAITLLYFVIFQLRLIPGVETDYGFLGIITPVLVWLGHSKTEKLIGLTIGLCLISVELGVIQLCSLTAVAVLLYYNGKRGKRSMKWFFYGYYPVHIAALYGIAQLVS